MAGCVGWQAVNPLCQVGGAIGNTGNAVATEVFASIARSFADLANSAVSWLWGQLDDATAVDLSSRGVRTDLVATGAIAALITTALFVIQITAAALRHDPGGLARGLRGMVIAFLGAAFAVAATQALLAAVDALSNGVVNFALGTDINGLGSRLIAADALARIGNPAGLLLMSLLLIAAVVVIWVALMVRKMLIIVSAVFAPIAFSGAANDLSRSWVRRWLEFTVALVASKLVLVVIFLIGLTLLDTAEHGSPGSPTGTVAASAAGHPATQQVTNLAIGGLTLLLAGFAPWIAIKTVHFAGDSFHLLHMQAGAVTAGAQTVIAAPRKIADTATATVPSTAMAGARVAGTLHTTAQPKPHSTGVPHGSGETAPSRAGSPGSASPGRGSGESGRGPAPTPTPTSTPTARHTPDAGGPPELPMDHRER